MRIQTFLLPFFILFSCSSINSDPVPQIDYTVDMHKWNESKGLDYTFLGRGINLGNYLESQKNDGQLDGEGSWNGGRKIVQKDIERIVESGFAHVRIPVKWSDYLTHEEPYYFDSSKGYDRVARVKEVLGWVRDAGLRAVMNVHHFDKLYAADTAAEMNKQQDRLAGIWNILSKEFPLSEYPADFLVFELCNEPHHKFTAALWNNMIPRLTNIIWNDNAETQNTAAGQRKIMVGAAEWGGVPGFRKLKLPAECTAENTIATIHFYEPFQFTHQGASWVNDADKWIGTRWSGSKNEKKTLYALMDYIDKWNTKGFEIYMGEFGVYSEYSDKGDQQLWTSFIARESERRGYSWAYWEYSAGFGAFDPIVNEWRPQLLGGLIPKDN